MYVYIYIYLYNKARHLIQLITMLHVFSDIYLFIYNIKKNFFFNWKFYHDIQPIYFTKFFFFNRLFFVQGKNEKSYCTSKLLLTFFYLPWKYFTRGKKFGEAGKRERGRKSKRNEFHFKSRLPSSGQNLY